MARMPYIIRTTNNKVKTTPKIASMSKHHLSEKMGKLIVTGLKDQMIVLWIL